MDVRERGWSTFVAAAIVAAAVLAAACSGSEAPPDRAPVRPQTSAATAPQAPEDPGVEVIPFTPAPPAYAGELPPLPMNPYPAPRPQDVIQAVYTFAARHPEVLHYVPCFCGCQRSGHKDNDDCFIQGRERGGRPVWDAHGMT
jgi:hypothetical protein